MARRRAFRDFDGEALRLDSSLGELVFQHLKKAGIGQIGGGYVDAEIKIGIGAQHRGKVMQRPAHHPCGDGVDKAVLLGYLDKRIGANRKAVLVGPARQRLGADDLTGRQAHDWLIRQLQLVIPDGSAKLLLNAAIAPVENRDHKAEESPDQRAQSHEHPKLNAIGPHHLRDRNIGSDTIGIAVRTLRGVKPLSQPHKSISGKGRGAGRRRIAKQPVKLPVAGISLGFNIMLRPKRRMRLNRGNHNNKEVALPQRDHGHVFALIRGQILVEPDSVRQSQVLVGMAQRLRGTSQRGRAIDLSAAHPARILEVLCIEDQSAKIGKFGRGTGLLGGGFHGPQHGARFGYAQVFLRQCAACLLQKSALGEFQGGKSAQRPTGQSSAQCRDHRSRKRYQNTMFERWLSQEAALRPVPAIDAFPARTTAMVLLSGEMGRSLVECLKREH